MSEYYDPLLGAKERKWLIKLSKWGVALAALVFIYNTSLKNVDWSSPPDPIPPVAQAVDLFQPSDQIMALANQIGLSRQAIVDTHVQISTTAPCGQWAVGCWEPSKRTITITAPLAFTYPNDPATTLGYEFSHFEWELLETDATRTQLRPLIDQWYFAHKTEVDASQANLIAAEGGYGTPVFEDELHSIVCTEVSDSELSPALLAHCSAFLPNRSVLTNEY